MADVEILIVGSPGRKSPGAATAGALQKHMLRLGASVRRVTSLDDDVQLVADEISAVLRRAPTLLALVAGSPETAASGLAAASEREIEDGVPNGAWPVRIQPLCLVMLVGATHVTLVPESTDEFEKLWVESLGDSLAEWFGHPPHVVGELMVLDSDRRGLNSLITAVGREHPGVYMKIEPVPTLHTGVRVTAKACGHNERSRRAVDAALAEMERAASAARLQVSSTGRIAAHVVGSRV